MHVTRNRCDAVIEPLSRGLEYTDERAQEAAWLRLLAAIDRRQVLHEAPAWIQDRELVERGQ